VLLDPVHRRSNLTGARRATLAKRSDGRARYARLTKRELEGVLRLLIAGKAQQGHR
jgi:FixJ family two-component response regulator